MSDYAQLLRAAQAIRAKSFCEVYLPDAVFMPLSTLSQTWFGVSAYNNQQRLTLGEYDLLMLRAQYEFERGIAEQVAAKLLS